MTAAEQYLWGFLAGSLVFRFIRLRFAVHKAREARGRVAAMPIFWIMAGGYLLYVFLCAAEAFRHLPRFSYTVSFLGLISFIGSLVLRERAMKDLGRFFSPDIEIRQGHRLVREGLYGYMRHPLLACMGLEILGVGLVFNAYAMLLAGGFGIYFPLIWVRKTLEERALLKTVGENYRAYMQEVGAFMPKFFQKEIPHG
ncbi:MAG: hypothetical protein A2992_06895 [Elusimicrobia bacterium RIFCSPLOWO2_01_FULL_59_12]|nr:MAG: hypothetical protein A2992_06895 [Elusimicrobia bacterium RIFCSPLOWO2_01_FULL_59_12]